MAEKITFKETDIWDDSVNGAGWSFDVGSMVEDTIETKAPLGNGFWLKPGGMAATSHKLTLDWHTTDPAALKATVESLATYSAGALVLPIWGTFSTCRLSDIGPWVTEKSDASTGFLVSNTLTFTEYP